MASSIDKPKNAVPVRLLKSCPQILPPYGGVWLWLAPFHMIFCGSTLPYLAHAR